MGSGCVWLLNGDAKFSADVARKVGNGLLYNCRQNTPARRSLGYPRSQRLTKEADLELVRRMGKRVQTEHLEARAAASLLFRPRIGVIVPKYGRDIVDRNRVKRRLRELVRIRLLPVVGPMDVIVRAKPGAYGIHFRELAEEISEIARRISGVTGQ